MGIDHKKNYAAASANFCVRSLLGVLLLSGAAMAHDGSSERDAPRREEPRALPARDAQPTRQAEPRQLDPRSYEARAEEQRRAMQEAGRNAEMNRRAGRLTPDERRDLRRQINEAGQDIYANPPRH
ncbi:hypothetical protein [Duganella violaceipulchra]|uniref:DUF4148 domain-containing protein n=1 Tax=Duganella violaceipulchra TaxID=2849652 RepID=A0ABT1GJ69_9BURK|nr:hypothetical protein [Duganella violaceicalia]MCP2009021.1 hypothetical protein [Duganella violaceicalia]